MPLRQGVEPAQQAGEEAARTGNPGTTKTIHDETEAPPYPDTAPTCMYISREPCSPANAAEATVHMRNSRKLRMLARPTQFTMLRGRREPGVLWVMCGSPGGGWEHARTGGSCDSTSCVVV